MHGNFQLDALEAEFENGKSDSMPVFLLKISDPTTRGLILRNVGCSTFSRLGVFAFHEVQKEWLGSFPTETVTLTV